MKANILISLMLIVMNTACVTTRKSFKAPAKASDNIEKILYYASLAGSSHNTQPWRAEILNDTLIRVMPDMSRVLPVVDPHSRGVYISLGAFLENLQQTSASMGYDAVLEYEYDNNTLATNVLVQLKRCEASRVDLRSMETRMTLRIPFMKEKLSDENVYELTAAQGVVYFPATSEQGKYISQNTLQAYTQQANQEDAKEELAGWMRFSNADVRKHRDGLTTSGMGITGIGGFVVSRMYKPQDSKKQSFIDTGIAKTRQQVENCAGWFIITAPDDRAESWIETGMKYQRIHLMCRNRMIGFHPMNQMIEMKDYENAANAFLAPGHRIHFVARVGYVKNYPEAVSVRRVVGEFTTDKR